MGEMKQLWNMASIQKKLESVERHFEDGSRFIEELYYLCLTMATEAKANHEYQNYKGQLESSIGVVILKDRNEIVKYTFTDLATDGYDPVKGIQDFRRVLNQYIVGKSELPNGIEIPEKGIIGIVFAAAPYSGTVEDRGRKVLLPFAPDAGYVFEVLKTAIK